MTGKAAPAFSPFPAGAWSGSGTGGQGASTSPHPSASAAAGTEGTLQARIHSRGSWDPSACRHPVPSTGRRHTARPAELRLVTVQARNGGIANQARRAFSNTDNVGLSDTVKRGRGSPVLSLRNQATQSCKRGGCLKPELVPLAEFYAHLSSAHALRTRVSTLMELGVPGADLVFS